MHPVKGKHAADIVYHTTRHIHVPNMLIYAEPETYGMTRNVIKLFTKEVLGEAFIKLH